MIPGKGSVALSEFVFGQPVALRSGRLCKNPPGSRLTWGETKESALAEIQEM